MNPEDQIMMSGCAFLKSEIKNSKVRAHGSAGALNNAGK